MRIGKYGKLFHWDNTSLGVGNIRRFTIFEIKYLGGIIVNIFNTVGQDRFHSHAFHALSLMLRGHYYEEVIVDGSRIATKKIEKSRFIPKNYIHKITVSSPNAMSITFEGPWGSTWDEYYDSGRVKTYTWGRKVLFDSKYFKAKLNDTEKRIDRLEREASALREGCERVKVLDNPAMRWIHRALAKAETIRRET